MFVTPMAASHDHPIRLSSLSTNMYDLFQQYRSPLFLLSTHHPNKQASPPTLQAPSPKALLSNTHPLSPIIYPPDQRRTTQLPILPPSHNLQIHNSVYVAANTNATNATTAPPACPALPAPDFGVAVPEGAVDADVAGVAVLAILADPVAELAILAAPVDDAEGTDMLLCVEPPPAAVADERIDPVAVEAAAVGATEPPVVAAARTSVEALGGVSSWSV